MSDRFLLSGHVKRYVSQTWLCERQHDECKSTHLGSVDLDSSPHELSYQAMPHM